MGCVNVPILLLLENSSVVNILLEFSSQDQIVSHNKMAKLSLAEVLLNPSAVDFWPTWPYAIGNADLLTSQVMVCAMLQNPEWVSSLTNFPVLGLA